MVNVKNFFNSPFTIHIMNTAIIVAAGLGKRFGAKKPKQFLEIYGKPLISQTLQKFEICQAIIHSLG